MAGRMISGAAALAELVRAAGETDAVGVHRMLPVVPELSTLLPGHGLRRGSTVAVATGPATAERATAGRVATGQPATGQPAAAGGGTSLLLALLAEASRAGSWCAVVGVPSLGAIAAAESGIALDRLALVPDPGPEWPTVVAALIDGVDLIVLAVPGGVPASIASRLVARARQRGSVLVPYGDWSGADVTLRVIEGRWEGLDEGHGRLRRRRVTVLARGRGAAARPKEITMWMPGVTIRPLTLPPPPALTEPTRPSAKPTPATPPTPTPAPRPTAVPAPASTAVVRSLVVSAAPVSGAHPAVVSGATSAAAVRPATAPALPRTSASGVRSETARPPAEEAAPGTSDVDGGRVLDFPVEKARKNRMPAVM